MRPTKPKKLPEMIDLRRWMERKISRHEDWETSAFKMEWEHHRNEEEWAWQLHGLDLNSGRRVMMACGLAHDVCPLRNFLVSEVHFAMNPWTVFEPNTLEELENGRTDEERPRGWQVVDLLLQVTAWNVRHHGLNHSSVLAGMVDCVQAPNSDPSFYLRPYGQWYSGRKSRWITTFDGLDDGCEYLRPIPLSEDPSEGERYVSVDDNVWQYVDADARAEERT